MVPGKRATLDHGSTGDEFDRVTGAIPPGGQPILRDDPPIVWIRTAFIKTGRGWSCFRGSVGCRWRSRRLRRQGRSGAPVGSSACPKPQADKARYKSRTTIPKFCCFRYIFAPRSSKLLRSPPASIFTIYSGCIPKVSKLKGDAALRALRVGRPPGSPGSRSSRPI